MALNHYEKLLESLTGFRDVKTIGLGQYNTVTVSYLDNDGRIQEKSSESFAWKALAERAFRMLEWYYFEGPTDKLTEFEMIWLRDFKEKHPIQQ